MNLTNEQLERLVLINEECAEVQQIISKILRHGYDDYSPFDNTKTSNKTNLEKELGDLLCVIGIAESCGDINPKAIGRYADDKKQRINKWLHYNKVQ